MLVILQGFVEITYLNLVVWLNCVCGLDVVWAELYCRLEKRQD